MRPELVCMPIIYELYYGLIAHRATSLTLVFLRHAAHRQISVSAAILSV